MIRTGVFYRGLATSICVVILLGAVGGFLLHPYLTTAVVPVVDPVVDPVVNGSAWETLVTLLKHEEGFRAFAYPDTRGFWTIGYGTKLPLTNADKNCVNKVNLSGSGPGLTKSQGDCLLRYRLSGYHNDIWKRWVPFHEQSEPVQMALLDMCYQLGVDGLLEFKLMLSAIAADDWAQATIEARVSRWDKETPSRVNRVVAVFAAQEL